MQRSTVIDDGCDSFCFVDDKEQQTLGDNGTALK